MAVFALGAVSAFAQQTKVVVIPLSSSQKVAKAGQTFAGNVSGDKDAGGTLYSYVSLSFPFPLPAGTATPILECLTATSANCPGIGQASPGYLCVYQTADSNLNRCFELSGANGDNKLYGYTLGLQFTNTTAFGYLIGSWAYQVP